MIPKTIHCVWVGGARKPPVVQRCMESWRRFCPGWEIREWGDADLDGIDNRYLNEARAQRKWAFVADYLRLKALGEHGGFYFDTDLELLRPIDEFAEEDFVTGFLDRKPAVYLNMCFIGAAKGNGRIAEMLAEYERIPFVKPNGELDQTPNVVRFAEYFKARGFDFSDPNATVRLSEKEVIHPVSYFNSRSGYAFHHADASWLDDWLRKPFFRMGPYKVVRYKRRKEAALDSRPVPLAGERQVAAFRLSPRKMVCVMKLKSSETFDLSTSRPFNRETPRRILLVSHELSVTGAPNSLLRQAKYLREAGYETDVWTFKDGELRERYEEAGFRPEVVADSRKAVTEKLKSLKVEKSKSSGPFNHYDLAICNTTRTYRAVDALWHCGVPVVWFIRETRVLDEDFWLNKDFAQTFAQFGNLYTVSEYNAEVVRRYNPNVRVIHNAVADKFRSFAQTGESVRFGFIGSCTKVKGLDVLIAAFAEVRREIPGCTLTIAGKPWTEFGRKLHEATKDAPGVVWAGEVQGAAKEAFFGGVDVLCVPSLDEPSGLTLIEGCMYGKAVVTTDHTGSSYLVGSDSGRIVPAGDAKALAAAMTEIARNPERIPAMQRAARERYLEGGTTEKERECVLKMVEENAGRALPVRGRMRKDGASWLFREERTYSGHRRFYFCGFKFFSCRGRGIRTS